jgi:AbrB family looped-hinge helix DNA binding protein
MVFDMKTLATVVTERGQVSIPSQIRRQMHIASGQKVVWEVLSDRECRMTVATQTHTPGAEAMLGYAAKFRKPRTTQDWMTELRAGDEA